MYQVGFLLEKVISILYSKMLRLLGLGVDGEPTYTNQAGLGDSVGEFCLNIFRDQKLKF